MAKHPYMKFYCADWIRDTRLLSPEARGVWVDMLCIMHNQKNKGVITGDITKLAAAVSVDVNVFARVFEELRENDVAEFEKHNGTGWKITSRRMQREEATSAQKSVAGKKGMKNRYNKNDNRDITTVITKTITEPNYNSNYNSNDNVKEGGTGETEEQPPMTAAQSAAGSVLSLAGGESEMEWLGNVTEISPLGLEECKLAFAFAKSGGAGREALARRKPEFFDEEHKLKTELFTKWADTFNLLRRQGQVTAMSFGSWSSYFINWAAQRDLSQEPEKIFNNAKPNGTKAHRGGFTAHVPAGTGNIHD
jgi:uncharacterized protein YdaU (DUF1376 family)